SIRYSARRAGRPDRRRCPSMPRRTPTSPRSGLMTRAKPMARRRLLGRSDLVPLPRGARPGRGGEPATKIFVTHRGPEQEALHVLAAERAQLGECLFALHALGDHPEAETLG